MKQIQLGPYDISQVILGTAQLGMDYGVSNTEGQPTYTDAVHLLQYAQDKGINGIDTARSYGNSEQVLGASIMDLPQATIPWVFITKFGLDITGGLEDIETLYQNVYASVESSAALLGIHKIPVCLFHAGAHHEMAKVAKILSVIFDRLKASGIVDQTGVSLYYPMDVRYILDVIYIDIIQVPFNLFDQRMLTSGSFARVKDRGIKIVARSVFLQGLFFLEAEALSSHLAPASDPLLRLDQLCRSENISIAQAAISFVRDIPEVDFLTIGAISCDQLDQIVDWMEGPSLTSNFTELIEREFCETDSYIITPGRWKM